MHYIKELFKVVRNWFYDEDDEEEMDPELQKRVESVCKDIRLMCKACGRYERGQVSSPAYGGGVYWEDAYHGTFDFSGHSGGQPGWAMGYFDFKLHCLGCSCYEVDRCFFYVDKNGKLLKFEDGPWEESLHKMAECWRRLLTGPPHRMSRENIDNL